MKSTVRTLAYLALLVFPTGLWAVEPEPAIKFPASMSVIEFRQPSPGSFIVRLAMGPGVEVYANKPENVFYSHVGATLFVSDSVGKLVKAKVNYPVGVKIEGPVVGDLFVYRGSVDMTVVLDNEDAAGPHALTLKVAGFSRSSSACLGTAKLMVERK
jgi:hypothetical protein